MGNDNYTYSYLSKAFPPNSTLILLSKRAIDVMKWFFAVGFVNRHSIYLIPDLMPVNESQYHFRIDYCGLGPILNNGSIFGTVSWI